MAVCPLGKLQTGRRNTHPVGAAGGGEAHGPGAGIPLGRRRRVPRRRDGTLYRGAPAVKWLLPSACLARPWLGRRMDQAQDRRACTRAGR